MAAEFDTQNTSNTSATTYASFWERFGALLIDSILLWIALAFLGNLLNEKITKSFIGIVFSIKGSLLAVITSWLYFALQESSVYQGTVGKRAFQLTVVTANHQRLTFLQASIRYFSKLISGFVFCIGYIVMIWDAQKRTWHDRIASTWVLKHKGTDA